MLNFETSANPMADCVTEAADANSPAASFVHPNQAHALDCQKILHVVNGEHFSGAERVQDHLAHRLPACGYEVSFACVKPNLFPQKRSYQAAPLYHTNMLSRFDFLAARKITRLIKEHDFRLVHAHTPRSAMLGAIAARKCQKPFVYHVHSPTSRDSTRWLINWFNQKMENWSLQKATRIVTVSDSLKQHMLSLGFQDSKISVVPNGVPIQPNPGYADLTQEFTIGTVALFRPRKGTEVLLEAIAKLKSEGLSVKLLAVGPFESQDYEIALKSKVKQLGIENEVEWTGFTSDVASHFQKMNLFVLPSLFGEGLPMVVLEAMSHRVPVVASDVEGIPQAVRDGIDGLIAKAGDADNLARQIALLAQDRALCEAMSESSYLRQRENFSDVSMAQGLAEIYNEILKP